MSRKGCIAIFCIGCLAALGVWYAVGGRSGILQRSAIKRQPMSYVGKVSLGTPTRNSRGVIIPISFSGGRWYENSGICFDHAESRVSGSEIELTVSSGICRGSGSSPPPERIDLARISPGPYAVFYRDPNGTRNPLGQIAIP
jgi:hypothetical protein